MEGVLDRLTVVLDEPFPDADVPRVRGLCRRAASVVCRNLGQIDLAREEGAVFDVAAPVTAAHAASVSWLLSCGARRVWLPDELGADEASAVLAALPGRRAARVGVLACGVPQLMVSTVFSGTWGRRRRLRRLLPAPPGVPAGRGGRGAPAGARGRLRPHARPRRRAARPDG